MHSDFLGTWRALLKLVKLAEDGLDRFDHAFVAAHHELTEIVEVGARWRGIVEFAAARLAPGAIGRPRFTCAANLGSYPNDPGLAGAVFHMGLVALDLPANPMGLVFSHGSVSRFNNANNGMAEVRVENTMSATGIVSLNSGTVWRFVYL